MQAIEQEVDKRTDLQSYEFKKKKKEKKKKSKESQTQSREIKQFVRPRGKKKDKNNE